MGQGGFHSAFIDLKPVSIKAISWKAWGVSDKDFVCKTYKIDLMDLNQSSKVTIKSESPHILIYLEL